MCVHGALTIIILSVCAVSIDMLWLQWSCIMITIIVHYDNDGRALRLGQLCIIKVMMVVHCSYNIWSCITVMMACIMVMKVVNYS